MFRGYRDLKVYQMAYRLAMEIFKESKKFPKEEVYSLTDQIRRSSRSVVANIAEGFRKRRYPNMFISKMADSDSEVAETQVWLDFALDCGYLSNDKHNELMSGYEEVGKMLGSMIGTPEKFKEKKPTYQRAKEWLPSAFCLLLTEWGIHEQQNYPIGRR
jgi:four helix bundle protein